MSAPRLHAVGPADEPGPAAVLPREWLPIALGVLPRLAREIADRIHDAIPEYGGPSGRVPAETWRAVSDAVHLFVTVAGTEGGAARRVPAAQGEAFRRLGRREARAGRSHDTLQSAYRIAATTVMDHLLGWELADPSAREVLAAVAPAVFAFIDDLARLSAEGFADEVAEQEDDDRARLRLLQALVHRDGFSRRAVTEAADRVSWLLPERITVAELVGGPGADIAGVGAHLFGRAAVVARVGDHWLAAAPDGADVVTLRAAAAQLDVLVVLGPTVALAEAAASARLARRLRSLHDVRQRAVDHVAVCDEHRVELLLECGRDTVRVLAADVLAPLDGLTATKRLKFARLLSAWLEHGTLHADEPGVLDKHRQTLRYQCGQLEQLFGEALHDRRSRLELMIALRSVLPLWERQAVRHTDTVHQDGEST